MRSDPPERLTDGSVVLQPIRDEDAAAYARAFREDPSLGATIGREEDPDEAKALDLIRQGRETGGDFVELGIFDAAGAEFLGLMVLVRIDERHRRFEVGFWVVPWARGRGVARGAVVLALDWAFEQAGMRRAELTTTPDNEATIALAKALGFEAEGVMRERNFERGRAVDVAFFGLLREDWEGSGR